MDLQRNKFISLFDIPAADFKILKFIIFPASHVAMSDSRQYDRTEVIIWVDCGGSVFAIAVHEIYFQTIIELHKENILIAHNNFLSHNQPKKTLDLCRRPIINY